MTWRVVTPGRPPWQQAKKHPFPATGRAFDLTGPLDDVPTGYLYGALKRERGLAGELAQRVAGELERRGRVDYRTRRSSGGSCALCDRTGLFIVGKTLYCRTHKAQAFAHLRNTRGQIMNERQQDYELHANDLDRTLRKSDEKRALHRGRNRPKA